ncbi:hypothetical protein ACMBCM_07745, partial [Spiroplasma sp. K1]
ESQQSRWTRTKIWPIAKVSTEVDFIKGMDIYIYIYIYIYIWWDTDSQQANINKKSQNAPQDDKQIN